MNEAYKGESEQAVIKIEFDGVGSTTEILLKAAKHLKAGHSVELADFKLTEGGGLHPGSESGSNLTFKDSSELLPVLAVNIKSILDGLPTLDIKDEHSADVVRSLSADVADLIEAYQKL